MPAPVCQHRNNLTPEEVNPYLRSYWHYKIRQFEVLARQSAAFSPILGRQLSKSHENSHQPTRRRERIMKRFKSSRQVQRFLSIHDQIANAFSRRPTQDTAPKFRTARNQAFTTWAEVTGVAMAA